MPIGYWLVTLVSQIAIIPLIVWWARRFAGVGPEWAWRIGTVLVAWFVAALGLAAVGAFGPHEGLPPLIGLGIAPPIAIGIYMLARPGARAPEASLTVLMALQIARVVGFEFVVAAWGGQLPGRFGCPAGWGDALIGVTAPLVALAAARRRRGWRTLAMVWNVAGILDLVDAVTLGMLSAPGPLQLFHGSPSTQVMGLLPLSLVPTFGVPLAVLGHFVALRALRGAAVTGTGEGGDVVGEKQVVLVTGVSSGIGEMTARALARDGHRVFGSVRSPGGAVPEGVERVVLDVRDDASVRAAIDEIVARAGRIDALVNNAGGTIMGALEETDVAQAQALFDVNFFGAVRVTNAVLPVMRKQRAGRIVFVSSVVGFLAGAVHGLLCGVEARARGVRGVARPRMPVAGRARGARRAGLHADEDRRERRPGGPGDRRLRGRAPARGGAHAEAARGRRRSVARRRGHRRGARVVTAEAAVPRGQGRGDAGGAAEPLSRGLFDRSFRKEFRIDPA